MKSINHLDKVRHGEEIIVIDPEKEYHKLDKIFSNDLKIREGVYMGLEDSSENKPIIINPFEINFNKEESHNSMVCAKAGKGMSFSHKIKAVKGSE